MLGEQLFTFGPYRLDPHNARLWRGKQLVPLTGKALAVLQYLAERPSQLVTKEELFAAVWPGVVVGESALTKRIYELRHALRDDPQHPRYIETVHRRGFRFIGKVVSDQLSVVSLAKEKTPLPLTTGNWQLPPPLVGRDTELAQLHSWLAKALSGKRQIVFVSGEPGIGKTTLVDTFLAQVAIEGTAWIGRGQCIEQYGAGEAYLPVLEALGRLCRESGNQHLIGLLLQHAPTWLVQMPTLLSPREFAGLQQQAQGFTRERMLRELADALEILTVERPLVLWLEDLHWSDTSTLELLSSLTRRHEPARVLVIGTYRPAEVMADGHALRTLTQELHLHEHCRELSLGFLSEEHIAAYLSARFAVGAQQTTPLQDLAKLIHRRTEGNPLFMVNVTQTLLEQKALVDEDGQWTLRGGNDAVTRAIPVTIQQFIEQQLDRLSTEEQRLLEAASVAGAEFSTATIAAGIVEELETVETRCAALARRKQFLRRGEEERWPDGTTASRYAFLHSLYQEVLYMRVSAGQRANLHKRIGDRVERGYGERVRERAAELAMHFDRGHDEQKAVQYLGQAAQNALQRSANHEAATLLTRGLNLLATMPATPGRIQQEIMLQTLLGASLVMLKGWAAPEVERAYTRAHELCQQIGQTPQTFPALLGLWGFYLNRAQLHTAHELGEQLMRLAQQQPEPALQLGAHRALGVTLYYLGELPLARAHLEEGVTHYDLHLHRPRSFLYSVIDPGVVCLSYAALALWLLGYPDQALHKMALVLKLTEELSHPFSQGFALNFAAILHQFRREGEATREKAEAAIVLATEEGFTQWSTMGAILKHWALTGQGQGAVPHLRQSLAAYKTTGAELGWPYFLSLLAEACTKTGAIEEGLKTLAEALLGQGSVGEYEAELWRLKGELLLAQEIKRQKAKGKGQKSASPNPRAQILDPLGEAEACFLKAIEISRTQQAKSLELRATLSLGRLWQQRGKTLEAHQVLSAIYTWFTEGFDTKDLQEARSLLSQLELA
jgi:DNA-binding winged helix-turn-helix (wHTH) protein/tetratricopeptide (TPR) repeat protein